MGRLTIASNQTEECEIRATLLRDTFEDESHSRLSSHSSQLVLHCPDCRAETFLGDQFCQECGSTQPAFENNKALISPDAVKTLLASRKKLLVASCALLFGVWSVTAIVFASNLPGELDRTISQNRLNDATALAERLFLSRFGALSGRDAESYSEAFYRRAQIFAKNRNFKLALGDLTKVLPSYSRSAEVAQLKASYQLFLSQGNLAVEPSLAATKEAPSVLPQTKTNDISAPAVSKTLAVGKTPARLLMQSVVSKTAKSEVADTAESTDLQQVDVANSDKEEVNSEEVDMAAYNRHLAEYFSRTESKNSKGSAVKEPPSFSEWVQSGKAEF